MWFFEKYVYKKTIKLLYVVVVASVFFLLLCSHFIVLFAWFNPFDLFLNGNLKDKFKI